MSEKVEPGLYWVKNKEGGQWLIAWIFESGDLRVAHPEIIPCKPESFAIGPRIPTADEIEEQGKWTRNPLCPSCGGIFHYIDDAYGECHRCGNHYEIETQYKVGKQG